MTPTPPPPTPPTAQRAAGSAAPTGVRTLPRIRHRRKAGPLHKIGMAVFAVGLLALCVDAALYASGVRGMPWWLHLAAVLAPLGLLVGFAATIQDGRRERSGR